tara:strand:- start:509 stop:1480 length:972 start_codon:yes stop_codon:yes gene_type:complete
MESVDVLIIGAGPIGLACGIEAQKRGLSYVIVEKGALVNSLYNYPLGMTFFSTSEKLEIGGVPFVSHGHKPTRSEALEYYRRVAQTWELDTRLYETIEEVIKQENGFKVTTSKANYHADSVIVATGFYDLPHKMNVPGEDLPKVEHYYREPHPYYNQKVVVVGASNSSVDAALECYRKGAEVTLLIRGEGIGRRVKYWVKPDIENRIEEGAIKAIYNANIVEIKPDAVVYEVEGKQHSIPNDFVLALTGYEPNFSFLEKLGVGFEDDGFKTPVHNKTTMETNVEGIYLAGVICGGLQTHKWFIENSRVHAVTIMDRLMTLKNN